MPLQPPVHANQHMVSTGHLLATQAGYEILEAGGTAIDAGIAAGIALGVVHSDMVQFAGVAPIMIYLAEEDRVLTISGLGPWPRRASRELLEREHGQVPLGILRTVVPAAPDAWITALRRFGTMSFGEVAAAAIRYAAEGFPMHHVMRDYIVTYEQNYRMWAQNTAIYLPGDRVPDEGERFVQADLARTIRFMVDEERAAAARGGRDHGLAAAHAAFYRGDLAQMMIAYHRENDGWLDAEDLAAYASAIEEPVKVMLGGAEVYTCGPWCQGPVLAQMVRLLEGFDLKSLGHNSADYVHLVTEAMKLAFADREAYYGDPRFVEVPMDELLSERYTAQRRQMIRPDRAAPGMPEAGALCARAAATRPPASTAPIAAPADTSYCCAIDRAGNVFSATPSDVSWESPIIPGTGFCPSSRGSQSRTTPGHPACVAPGKRPRLTPNPALARRPGEWMMPFGTPGGDNQTQAMLQVLLNVECFGMRVQDAIEAPRFMSHSFPNSFAPHHYYPARLTVEGRIAPAVTDRLSGLGHDVERMEPMTYKTAGVCAIRWDQRSGILEGGADPRRMSRAMGR